MDIEEFTKFLNKTILDCCKLVLIKYRLEMLVAEKSNGEYSAEVDIQKVKVIRGSLPKKQLNLTLAWAQLHQDELMDNWNNTYKGKVYLK